VPEVLWKSLVFSKGSGLDIALYRCARVRARGPRHPPQLITSTRGGYGAFGVLQKNNDKEDLLDRDIAPIYLGLGLMDPRDPTVPTLTDACRLSRFPIRPAIVRPRRDSKGPVTNQVWLRASRITGTVFSGPDLSPGRSKVVTALKARTR
jgi:hypothetical protein